MWGSDMYDEPNDFSQAIDVSLPPEGMNTWGKPKPRRVLPSRRPRSIALSRREITRECRETSSQGRIERQVAG